MNPIDNPNEDTEFNDILRQHGILPPKQERPRTPSPPPAPSLAEAVKDKPISELNALEEDADDSETERMISKLKRDRLAEMRRREKLARFGEVVPISRDDYARAVTEASKADEPDAEEKGLGTGIVVIMYKDGDPPSTLLLSQLRILAKKYPRTKFVSIIGNKCVEGYPDRLQPTLVLYRNGEVMAQVVSWGKDRPREPAELEALLVVSKVVYIEDQAPPEEIAAPSKSRQDESDEDLDSEDERPKPASRGFNANRVTKTNIRGRTTVEDDDSDFDL